MPKGKIEEYHVDQGYGSVVDAETGQLLTIYANYTCLKQGEVLQKGQEVEYEIENNRHQERAINVRIVQKMDESSKQQTIEEKDNG